MFLFGKNIHQNLRFVCTLTLKRYLSSRPVLLPPRLSNSVSNDTRVRKCASTFALVTQPVGSSGQLGICNVWFSDIRHYAKKAKDSGNKESASASVKKGRTAEKLTVQLSSEELNEVINFDKMKQQMELALDHLSKDYVEQLALRTSATMFDTLTVDTTDGQFSLIEIAQVTIKSQLELG